MVARGFLINHQKVSVNVNLNGTLNGYTEVTLTPTAFDLKVVWLNANFLKINSVSLKVYNSSFTSSTMVPLAFSHDPPALPTLTKPDDIHTYPELKRSMWRAGNEGEEGELGIALPPGIVKRQLPTLDASMPTPKDDAKKEEEWEPLTINIQYEVNQPGPGIVAVGPDETNPSRFPHVFTSAASDTAARTWVPCSDHLRDRCIWDLEFVVPRLLYAGGSSHRQERIDSEFGEEPEDEEEVDEEWPISVVASGELQEQVVHPDRSDRVVWRYSQSTSVSAQQIAWAVGPFVVTEILGSGLSTSQTEAGEEDNVETEEAEVVEEKGPKLYALCLPGREDEVKHSVGVIKQAMDFYTSTSGSYPFTSYTVAFIDSVACGSPTFHSAAMTLFSSDLLHPPSIIDQAYETRQTLAHALAVQWSGINLIARHPSDSWLIVGIALHITSLFLKQLWGNNEYRFRLKKDMIRCVAQDVQREALCVPARASPPEPEQMQFIALKAPLVLHILDKQLRKSGTSLGLDKVLPKLFLDAITSSSGGTNFNTLNTNMFMRTCRKACGGSGEALKTFFDQWVYASGCPTFLVSAVFNRKKMAIELNVTQECRASNWATSAPWEEAGHTNPMPHFEGLMTIRIHEADGTPYEHVLNIQEGGFKRHEVPFNTKYKRIRRNTKRYQARQAAATAAASGDAEAQEAMGLVDVGFGLTLWEEEAERERWQVADWTEADDVIMNAATYEWIRIDAELDWICDVHFEQPDFMWISQLQRDRDVVAQLEAVHALSRMPSPIAASNLTKAILVDKYFFRVRMEACLALVSCATKVSGHLGLFHLLKLFQTRYCFEPESETKDPFAFRCIPKTNDFTDLQEYFLKKSIVTALSMVRDELGQTPPVIQQFLVDLLAYNDNLGNPFADTFYITTIMTALGHTFVAVAGREAGQLTQDIDNEASSNVYLEPAVLEVQRYMDADRLVPSYHNAITVAGLEWQLKLALSSLVVPDRKEFLAYTRDGNYPAVRIAAFEGLLLFNPLNDATTNSGLIRYIFSVLREDSSLLVQRRLAQAILWSIPVLVAVQDLAAPELIFEEDGAHRDRGSIAEALRALRKAPGRSVNYRKCLLAVLTDPDVDPEVRWSIIKLCEVTAKTGGEPMPKVRLRMSSMVAESPAAVAPPTPAARITFNAGSSSAAGTRVTFSRPRSPLAGIDEYFDHSAVESAQPIKPKKIKIPAAQPYHYAGMDQKDLVACQSTLKKLMRDKSAIWFKAPVDPVKSGATTYYDIIKSPMDLGTMKSKLAEKDPDKGYRNREEFRADFKLIIQNAHTYNGAGPVVDQANILDTVFDKQWNRLESSLAKIGNKVSIAVPQQPLAPLPEVAAEASSAHYYAESLPAPTPIPASVPTPTPTPTPPPAQAAERPFALKLKPLVPMPSPPPPPPPTPAVAAEPVKATGFKLKLGGSSVSLASQEPVATSTEPGSSRNSLAKPPKAPKMVHSSSHHDDDEFVRPALPIKVKSEKKSEKKKKGKEVISYAEDVLAPELDLEEEIIPTYPIPAAVAPLHMPPPPSTFISSDKAVDVKKARGVLNKMKALPQSYFFREPVIAEGSLSSYYIEIKQPMDLKTIGEKLERNGYRTYGQLFKDFALISSNCKQFNPPGTEPVLFVDELDVAWRLEWEKASKMAYNTRRSLQSCLKNIAKDPFAGLFLEPIDAHGGDWVATYEAIIPRSQWRDLGTIQRHVAEDRYSSLEEVDADIVQMVNNCTRFNGEGTDIDQCGQTTLGLWKAALAKVRSEGKGASNGKRAADGKGGGGGPSKKQKA